MSLFPSRTSLNSLLIWDWISVCFDLLYISLCKSCILGFSSNCLSISSCRNFFNCRCRCSFLSLRLDSDWFELPLEMVNLLTDFDLTALLLEATESWAASWVSKESLSKNYSFCLSNHGPIVETYGHWWSDGCTVMIASLESSFWWPQYS